MNTKKIALSHLFVFAMTSFVFNFSYAGSWISSGGDFLKDAGNPWFVRNTKSISYCIQVDEKTISASPADIHELVAKAFEYWKKEFVPLNQYKFIVALGTQSLTMHDCNGREDIRFQFGSGTLSKDQQNYFKHYKVAIPQIIAQTTRTNYDYPTLRGRGFIFIASDKGETSYDTGKRLVKHAWRNKGLMYRALVHEIGHIYGIPHIGNGIMAENYMEEILDSRFYKEYADSFELGSFFQGRSETSTCNINIAARSFFKLDAGIHCLFVSMEKDGERQSISASASYAGKREILGTIEYDKIKLGEGSASFEAQPGIRLWLPPEQQVFDKKWADEHGPSLSGPMFYVTSRSARFLKKGTTNPQSIMVTTGPGKQQIIAQDNNGIRIVYSAVVGKRTYAE